MAGNIRGKRSSPPPSVVSKKRKLNNGKQIQVASRYKATKKEKAADRGMIPIPNVPEDDENIELSEQDLTVFTDFGQAAGFLKKLDQKGIMRSKKATQKLHELSKPVNKPRIYNDDLPSLNSDDDGDEDEWSSNIDDNLDDTQSIPPTEANDSDDSDAEMPYETLPRKLPSEWRTSKGTEVRALPIKLACGKVKDTGVKVVLNEGEDESESDASDKGEERETTIEDVSTGARFGRPAVVDVLQTKSRKKRVEIAKEQIASICQEILADPENSLGLLRRLHTFALPTVTTPAHPDPVSNDPIIRQLTILSQLAVFKDIIPGYRIRPLTEIEKAEKVSQMVAQTRDWEQGLVSVYQAYLRLLEAELKGKGDFADVAMHCMCTLLTEVTHFNFRDNLMTCLVSRLSKRSWDKTSEHCSQSLITVFRRDITGEPSLEIVRLLNRMIKERQYKIHPNVLSCLLHLRLRTELGVRASNQSVDKPETGRQSLKKKSQKVHFSKKTKKVLKEQKEIRKELQEAEAEVDKEDRKATQTETLKLLFTIYFRILKNPSPSPLLPSALSGVSKFAHLVNIDFFKDLMGTLKHIISKEEELSASANEIDLDLVDPIDTSESMSRRLMCIVTAFELLSGQGEALNIDLSEFIAMLYASLMTVTLATGETTKSDKRGNANVTELLFRALDLVFTPRSSASVGAGAIAVPWRAAAFAKRLLSACLHWSTTSAILRTLALVKSMVAKDPKVEAMLSTEDRISNGVYRPDVDDPQLCQPFETAFWELHVLRNQHWDPKVRGEAEKLLNYSSR